MLLFLQIDLGYKFKFKHLILYPVNDVGFKIAL